MSSMLKTKIGKIRGKNNVLIKSNLMSMIGTHNLSYSHFPLVKTIYYLMAERLTTLTLPSTLA